MGATELACSAFGQGFTCTMIQEINAMCSVINGGYYYQPHLVTRIKDANGGVVKSYSPILLKQTISANISADVRSYMALSVKQGTSIHSKVEGYSSGGKTGTAEKLPRGNGKYLTSFITFAPVDDPRVVIYVVVDEPNVEEQATSLYAQYIAQGIMSELLPYLNVVPDEPGGDVSSTEIWEGFDGYLTSTENAVLDEDGNLWDVQGNRIDWDGNRIDEDGYILDNYGNYKYDEYGDPIESKALDRPSDLEGNEGVSDTNVPPPLEDDYSDVEWDNDIETEGLTNEEADIW
jgi:stage V sporulation protein D (sporulation-specific penicillin-binding protein)